MKHYYFICFTLIFFAMILIGRELEKKEAENNLLKIELKECRKQSYKRFELAKDLLGICDEYKSSQKAKNKYIMKHEIID